MSTHIRRFANNGNQLVLATTAGSNYNFRMRAAMFLEIITFSDSEIIDRMQYPTLYAILANTIARRH